MLSGSRFGYLPGSAEYFDLTGELKFGAEALLIKRHRLTAIPVEREIAGNGFHDLIPFCKQLVGLLSIVWITWPGAEVAPEGVDPAARDFPRADCRGSPGIRR